MTRQRTKLQRHEEYIRAKAKGKITAYHREYKTFSPEEKERRRISSAKWRAEHPDRTKENMRRWRELYGKEERRSAQEYRRNNKKLAIEYLGGKCIKCGGVFHPDVYDFHHRDENEKDVCVGRLLGRKFHRIIPELDKCILLCSNCHRIEHAEY